MGPVLEAKYARSLPKQGISRRWFIAEMRHKSHPAGRATHRGMRGGIPKLMKQGASAVMESYDRHFLDAYCGILHTSGSLGLQLTN